MPALEQRVDRERAALYAGPLGGFTAARTARAKQLRSAGDGELADAVAKLPKPTVAAWAVDQVAQHYPRELSGFLDAGKAVRRAQAKLLDGRGSRVALDEALEEERRQARSLAELARGLLADGGQKPTDATLEKVRETLHAATLDEQAAAGVAAGTLSREQRASGFDALLTMPVKRGRAGGRSTAPARPPASAKQQPTQEDAEEEEEPQEPGPSAAELRKERLSTARAELREARDEVAGRRRELREAERAAEQAREALRRAEERQEAAEAELKDARG